MNDLPLPQNDTNNALDVSRRDFVKTSSFAAAMSMLGGVPIFAQDAKPAAPAAAPYDGPTIKCAVIGLGVWGREILNTLARFPKASVIAVCDSYAPFLTRGKEAAPKAEGFTDYKEVLKNPAVQAVLIATPTHLHKEIVLAALAAGKHVYCEAPIANSIEDAREIARAARDATRSYFQAGLLMRSDPQRKFILPFVRSGAMGQNIKTRAQWHKKTSWRRTAPNQDRANALNWRLSKETSTGLIGELGSQQIDVMQWFLAKRPVSVTGFGGIQFWQDGRDVEDTIQAVFQYEDGSSFNYEASLATSFDSELEVLYGSDATIMLRGSKAWLFKEADSPLLGWEVYAKKEQFFNETGISLAANASKSASSDQSKGQNEAAYADPPIYFAMESFLENTKLIAEGIEDYVGASFDLKDTKALQEYLAALLLKKKPAATYKDGFEASVITIKANEAIAKKGVVKFDPAWFEI